MKKVLKFLGSILLALVFVLASFVGYRYYKVKTFKDTRDLQAQIATRCNKYISNKKCVGLAIGVIQGDKIYAGGFGYLAANSNKLVDTNTVFEIGSITKTFTAELTQILVDRNTIQWNETMYDVLPEPYKPTVNDSTTLLSLVTHTSGFPRTPHVLLDSIAKTCNAYKGMSPSLYASCVKNLTEKKKPDANSINYSNIGFAILANCLEAKVGTSYDSLLQFNIFGPLGMHNTTLYNTDTTNFATGYDANGNETCHWDFAAFYAGCGGIRSNIIDMLKFLQANITDNTLFKPFSETQQPVYKSSTLAHIGKAWMIRDGLPGIDQVIWHNGGTGGFKCYIGFIPGKKIGVIILSNQENQDLDMLGFDMVTLASRISMQ